MGLAGKAPVALPWGELSSHAPGDARYAVEPIPTVVFVQPRPRGRPGHSSRLTAVNFASALSPDSTDEPTCPDAAPDPSPWDPAGPEAQNDAADDTELDAPAEESGSEGTPGPQTDHGTAGEDHGSGDVSLGTEGSASWEEVVAPQEEVDEETDGPPVLTEPAPRCEDELRVALGLDPHDWVLPASVRLYGWIVTGVVGLLATLTRLVGLSHPTTLMFDEIYYAKDAYALWHNGYESVWTDDADQLFSAGDVSALTTEPGYIVHPQLGKWLIGLGMEVFGVNSVGWRIVPAVAGILTVIALVRLTMRLTRSPLLAGIAGLLLTMDGTALTESRIALLDGFISLFAVLAVYCVVRDREWSRARLARDLAGTLPGHLAPRAHLRPWLLAAGATLGLACSIKWSGLYLLAAIGILVLVWDTLALRRVRAKVWLLEGLISRGIGDAVRLVPIALAVYVAGWWSWFLNDGAYKHGWAASQRTVTGQPPRSWLPDSLNDLLEYHLSMYQFHVKLDSEHPYMSSPFGWLLQVRPTSFYWPDVEELAGVDCGADRCVEAITSVGNIPVWWAALAALAVAVLGLALRDRDWRVWVALIGYIGLYLPWFMYLNRTIFTFYTVAFVPFVVLVLTLVLGAASGLLAPVPGSREAQREARLAADGALGPGIACPRGPIATYLGFGMNPTRLRLPESWTGVPSWRLRSEGLVMTAVVVTAAVVFAVLWWPIWTGQTVSYDFWRWHMLLPSWI